MYHLATLIPPLQRVRRLPLSRDQLMLLIAAINEIFLSVDVYLAHSTSGQLKPNEWIPVIFGVTAGVLLLLAGVIAIRFRPLATILANIVLLASVVVGLLGIYFHLSRTVLLSSPLGQQSAVSALIWAPPVLGPAAFILVGVLGISAAWIESPPDSGALILLGQRRLRLPYSKTRAYFFIVALFALITVISSTLDHAQSGMRNPLTWLPLFAGVFAVSVSLVLGLLSKPSRSDLSIYTATMLMLIVVGVVGAFLHLNVDLVPNGTVVIERFLRGSPLMAPLLYANVGLIGLIVLLNPGEGNDA